MAAKTPIRTVFNSSNVATGLAEYQSGEFVPLSHGGIGAALSIGSAGQVLKVNSGASALEFGSAVAIVDIDSATDGSSVTLAASDKFLFSDGGTEKYLVASQIDTYVSGTSSTLTNKTLTAPTINGVIGGTTTSQTITALTTSSIAGSDLTMDASGDISLDADGGDVFFKDGGSTYGSLTNSGGNLVIKSNTTTAITMSGANVTVAGNLTVQGTTTTVDSSTINIQNAFVFEGATADAYETTLTTIDPTGDRTISLPNATDTLVGKATIDTFTNKSIDLGSNTLTGSLAEFNSALQGDSFATLTGTNALTNKTFTTPTATSPVLNTAVSGSAVADEDNMSSNSATKLATQQSIKAYVDAQTTAQDLDIAPDSGTAQSIDLDSETLTFSGGNAISTSASGNTVTMSINSPTIATLSGSQTLTNKTFTSPTINTWTFSSGTSTSGMQIGSTGIVFEGATADAHETTLNVAEPSQDNVITIPDASMTLLTTATHASKFTHIVRIIALS